MIDLILLLAWLAGALTVCAACYAGVSAATGPELALRLRLVVTVVVVLVGQYLVGLALLLSGAFGIEALVAVFALAAAYLGWALRSTAARAFVAADLDRVRTTTLAPSLPTRWRKYLAVAAAIAFLYALRATVTPPMDWDFLTYHGPRAAFWVQEGRLTHSYDAVGLWEFYRSLPMAGDMLSAWSMVLVGGDVAIAPTWTCIWLATGMAAHAAVRGLDGAGRHAVLAAAIVLSLPASFHHMSSGYVDNAVLLGLLAGIVCFVEAERAGRFWLATMGLVACALAVALKWTALPFMATSAALWLWLFYRHRREIPIGPTVCGLVLMLATVLIWPLLLWIQNGNPLYPFPIDVFGFEFAGSTASDREWGDPPNPKLGLLKTAHSFFFWGFHANPLFHNGFGPGGLLILLAGSTRLTPMEFRCRPTFTVSLAVGILLLLWMMQTQIENPGLDEARYALFTVSLATIAVACSRARWATGLLTVVLVANLFYALPWRWGGLDFLGVAACVGAGAALATLIWLVWRRPGRLRATLVVAGCLSLVVATLMRPYFRADYYSGLAQKRHFNSGPLSFFLSVHAYPIWEKLAEADPLVVAVAAGTRRYPTHWYIYPLLGDRYQHRLVYIPTGLYFPDEREAASPLDIERAGRRWLAELEARAVDVVMLYAPDPIEFRWIAAYPQYFKRIAASGRGDSALYAVDLKALRLAARPGRAVAEPS
ncbi:MAG: hypothetical protein QF893_24945 [Alphaproteobacteria bacterium]|jgi:4-amino-4-deoxy-L-arabinose transferase-like glycosyltransferase|nr:hypothetical protein [Alphaproteobacteria bacterium]